MRKRKSTPEKLVCEFCGKEKTEITFTIGACSPKHKDWCMIFGTGKMACPDCYDKAQADAKVKEDKFMQEHFKIGVVR